MTACTGKELSAAAIFLTPHAVQGDTCHRKQAVYILFILGDGNMPPLAYRYTDTKQPKEFCSLKSSFEPFILIGYISIS